MIGCGGIGKYHLNHLLSFSDIELAGFCDPILEQAEKFVSEAGSGRAFTNYKEMYDKINPDMVFICIPPAEHGEVEFETINRRIPFFVEKPIALSTDLAKQICYEVKKAELITAVGFQCRYSNLVEPNVRFIKEKEIIFVDCIRIGSVPRVAWWKKRSASGGQIVEQTIHQLDIIRYVLDEPNEVFTMGTKGFITDVEDYDTEDLSTTVVRFKSGALATISTGCYATSSNAADSKIVFSSRDSRAELRILDDLKIFGDDEIAYKEKGDAGILCDRAFIDSVLTSDGSKIRSSYEDAVCTLEFALACNRSMDTGLPVEIGS